MRLGDDADLEEIRHAAERVLLRFATRETDARAARRWLQEEIQSRLLILLGKRGVDASPALRWSTRLATLLELRMLPALVLWLGRRFTEARDRHQPLPQLEQRAFMAFFETRRQALDQAAEEMLDHLEQWLEKAIA